MSRTAAPEPPQEHADADEAQWPLRFKSHYFDAHCFSTYGCHVTYGGRVRADDPGDVLAPQSEALGARYPGILTAGMGPIPNFPSPAQVRWRSRDGTTLEAQVDIAEIFKDELIRHRLRRDEIPEATLASDHSPGIILEVNDRTINVYMRAHISTRELQIPGNRHSDFRDDLIKVFSRTY